MVAEKNPKSLPAASRDLIKNSPVQAPVILSGRSAGYEDDNKSHPRRVGPDGVEY